MKKCLWLVSAALVLGAAALPAVAVSAPKLTIAVGPFDNKSGWSGSWDIGWGMQEMLATSLINAGKFTVLERQALDEVLKEQDLGASGRTAEGSAAAVGKLGKSQILIAGAVTEFEYSKGGEDAGISIKGFSIGGSQERAHVALNLRIFDTTTGEVLDSLRVAGEASTKGLKLGYSNSDFGGDLGGFRKTPMGEATQKAIDEAVTKIVSRLRDVPWQGKIIKADAGKIFINAGSEAGVAGGAEFAVYRAGEALTDPDTGMSLGQETTKVGKVKVTEVKDKFSIAAPAEGTDFKRGDLIKAE
jgi:curli biogenesis system outer membrane secretion channel CsgG